MKVHMNSPFPVPSQQSSYLERLRVCSCHLPQRLTDEGVFCSTDKRYIVHCSGAQNKSVEHTMNLSPVSFKKMKNKRKTSFTWDVFLSMKLALPILKENIILSVFKSLLYSLLLLPPNPTQFQDKSNKNRRSFFFLLIKCLSWVNWWLFERDCWNDFI